MDRPGVTARLLDLTRLVSRLGRGPLTGVDRVEAAYLQELLGRETPLFALVRTAAGHLLLDRAGAQAVAALVAGAPLGPIDLLSRMTNRRDPQRGRAEATVRRLAIARAPGPFLGHLLRRLPAGTSYLNTGHANLSDRTLSALHRHVRIGVLLHDTIPLDHPDYSRPDTVASFRRKIAAVSAHADLVIHTAKASRALTEPHLHRAGRVPPGIVAHLGVPPPQRAALPVDLQPVAPYFVALGTVEPRKNHALLLRVWNEMARTGSPPALWVIGARGWARPDLFDQLAATPGVRLVSGLADGAVTTLLEGASALLFPSLAEGFGLPPIEAAALGTPVIASDLPVIRELLGDYPIYLDPTDSYSWLETINRLNTSDVSTREQTAITPPLWDDHFNTVLNFL